MAAPSSLSISNILHTLPSTPTFIPTSQAQFNYSETSLFNFKKPILSIKDKSFSNYFSKLNQPFIIRCRNTERNFFLKAYSSDPLQESSPQTINEPDADEDKLIDSENSIANLKSLLQVYKVAIIDGDIRTISQIEGMIGTIDKDQNQLAEKVSILSAEISSGKDKYIRLQADFDNFRKRSEKERINIRSDAKGEIIETLLPMVDNFERAKEQLKLETEQEKKIDSSYQGIYKQFVEIMRSLRVSAVPTIGEPFDPMLHEAIAREESEEYKEGIVTQEFRRGFRLGDRLLRPAMVKVSSGPGKKKQPATTVNGVDENLP